MEAKKCIELDQAVSKYADSFESVQKLRAKAGKLGAGAAVKQLRRLGLKIMVLDQSVGE